MGNINIGRVLPMFDTLLLLVTAIFSTAGLLRSMEPDPKDLISPERDRLAAEVKAKMAEADELAKKLDGLRRCGDLGLDALQTLLQAAGSKQEKLARIQGTLADARGKLEGAKTVVQNKYNSVALEKAIKTLTEKAARLEEEKAELEEVLARTQDEQRRIQELKMELETLRQEIERLEIILKTLTGSGPWPTGGYYGPFILIECDDKGAQIYPGGRQISLDALESEKEWLKQRVLEKGAALLIVRPSGFDKSYNEFKKVLVDVAQEREGKDEQGIILTFWPVDEHAGIGKYMPEGEAK